MLISFAVWGFWPMQILDNSGELRDRAWNFSPFPLGIPVAIYLLYKAWQSDDEVMAAAATPLLVPYFAPYSLVSLMALLASRHKTIAIFIYWTFWFYLIVESRRIAAME